MLHFRSPGVDPHSFLSLFLFSHYHHQTKRRAALVDRLLSSALCTEFVLANLDLGGGEGTCRAEGGGTSADFVNSFGALDTDDDDDDDDDNRSDDDEKRKELEGNGVTGGGSPSFDPPKDADAHADADAQRWAEAAGEGVQATGDGGAAAADEEGARRSGSGSGGNDGGGGGGCSSSGGDNSGACRGAKNFTSGMEAVFRLYGAALIKFRVSVFLYCSASAAAPASAVARVAGGGGDDEQGPSELTMRRQRVVCAENLEAVATHLRPAGEGGRVPDAPEMPEASTARQWLRVAVGRAALCEGDDTSFSTRVAALLLSRSGERGGPPRNGDYTRLSSGATKAEGSCTRGGGRERAKPTRRETEALAEAAAVEAAAVAAATAEFQFRRDPWPERDLPRASEKAALLFRDRNSKANTSPNCAPPPARLGRGDDPEAVDARSRLGNVFRGDASGDDSRDLPWGPCTYFTAPPPPPCAGKKRKRGPQGRTSCAAREPCLPPHYVGLVSGLPRDSRRLLARLGHQGYVKVLEELLNRFLYSPNALAIDAQPGATATVTVAAVTTAAVATQGASARRASPIARPRVRHIKAGRVVADAATTSASKATTVDTEVAAFVEADEDTVCLQSPLDDAPNPWRAVQTGKPHPSLSGLVEPPELARTGPRRMVLPIPNPFYRRVLHALCRVHGVCSHGGETSGDRGGAETGRGKAAIRHRTVEITRVAVGGSSRGRRRGRAERQADATALIPVETLLGAR